MWKSSQFSQILPKFALVLENLVYLTEILNYKIDNNNCGLTV